jgi:two-component system cell cycle response regulator DivK
MSYILLVEDNQANADMIIHILASAHYQVRHCIKGLQGAKLAREERPDLILMDFNLPDIDGRMLVMVLKKQMGVNAPPIVACTARTSEQEKLLAKQYGCSAFLGKPFSSQDLLTVVERFVPLPQSDEQAPPT